MKHIEFLGLPGSGKTTTAREVLRILRSRHQQAFTHYDIRNAAMRRRLQQESGMVWKILRVAAIMWESRMLNIAWQKHRCDYIFRFISEYPQLTRHIITCGERAAPPEWMPRDILCGKNLIEWIFDIASYYQAGVDTLSDNAFGLLEEGFCQHAYYLFAFWNGQFDEESLRTYLDLIPNPDVLVFLLTEAEDSEARMQARSKGVSSDILRPLTVEQRLAVLDERLKMYATIADHLEHKGTTVIRLEHHDYQQSYQMLKQHLARFVTTAA